MWTHLIGLVDTDFIIFSLCLRTHAMLFVGDDDDDDVDVGFAMVPLMAMMLMDYNPVAPDLLLVV